MRSMQIILSPPLSLRPNLNPMIVMAVKQKKRSLSTSATTAPPLPKKTRIEMASSVRSGLESGTPHGILRFFKKATEEDHQAYLARSSEEIQQRMEEDEWKNNRIKERKKMIERKREKKKKREQRDRKKKQEIIEGLRSPGGTKKKVCAKIHIRPNYLTRNQGSQARAARDALTSPRCLGC
jgi:hypothetical protein